DVAAVDQALEVHVDHSRVVGQRDVPERADGADADVVDPDVDAAEAFQGAGAEGLHLVRIADVGGHRERCSTGRLAFCGDLAEQLAAARGQHHIGAGGGQLHGRAATQAAGSAGD